MFLRPFEKLAMITLIERDAETLGTSSSVTQGRFS